MTSMYIPIKDSFSNQHVTLHQYNKYILCMYILLLYVLLKQIIMVMLFGFYPPLDFSFYIYKKKICVYPMLDIPEKCSVHT